MPFLAAWAALLLLNPTSLLSPPPLLVSASSPPSSQQHARPPATRSVEKRATVDIVRGVNLGGWLVTESWITPSLYRSAGDDIPDEWTFGVALGKDRALSLLSDHWDSFYSRSDMVDIKAAGLTHVRIPIGYWAVDVLETEPYVSGQYPYLIRAVNWAQEVGLGVMIDLHGLPGSQNGQDNSGRIGDVLFAANTTNLDRSLNVLRNLTEEFTQDLYGGAVEAIEIMNEPRLYSNATGNFTMAYLKSVYGAASDVIRTASDQGMTVTFHDAFWGPNYWADYNPSSSISSDGSSPDWLQLDTHQYYAFAPLQNLPRAEIIDSICNVSKILKSATSGVPQTVVGEWSLETGTPPNASTQDTGLSRAKRTWLRLVFEAQLAAYSPTASNQTSKGWYFWCWKTQYGYATWDYRAGIKNGYIPSDVSNASLLVYPILTDGDGAGCIDAGYNYTAPARAHPDGDSAGALVVPGISAGVLVGWLSVAAALTAL